MKKLAILLITTATTLLPSCDEGRSGSLREQGTVMSYLYQVDNSPVAPVPAPCQAVSYGTPAPADAPLRAEGDYFRDGEGRVVILRGVNVAGNSKVPPFTPITGGSMLDPLPSWGFNTIRLLFTWEAFEPVRCSYAESYLQYYEQVVEWAGERGLYVLVDFHQDAYSRYSIGGCGDGFPEWAVTPAVAPVAPNNGSVCTSWGIQMIMDVWLQKTWKDFHLDLYGSRTRYLDMVEAVADRMSRFDNVIGYDIINEPSGSDAQLSELFQLAAERIRGRHPNAVLFVPPAAMVSSGMVANNMQKPGFANFAYSPHFYDGMVTMLKTWTGGSPAGALDAMKNKAVSWQAPMVLSEFGAPAETANIAGYMEALYDWLDDRFVSGIQWCYTPGWRGDIKDGWNMEDFSIVDDTGRLRAGYVPRPYPQKIAGMPGLFTRTESGFSMSWTNTIPGARTEIFLPEHYADDKTISLSLPEGIAGNYEISGQTLACTVNGTGDVRLTLSR